MRPREKAAEHRPLTPFSTVGEWNVSSHVSCFESHACMCTYWKKETALFYCHRFFWEKNTQRSHLYIVFWILSPMGLLSSIWLRAIMEAITNLLEMKILIYMNSRGILKNKKKVLGAGVGVVKTVGYRTTIHCDWTFMTSQRNSRKYLGCVLVISCYPLWYNLWFVVQSQNSIYGSF